MSLRPFPTHHSRAIQHWPTAFFRANYYKMAVEIHGVPLTFYTSSKKLIEDLKIFFPLSWQHSLPKPIDIYWCGPQIIKELKGIDWDQVENPDCQFKANYISQRDFLVKKITETKYELMTEEKIDDGFFNFLRAILPIKLLGQKKVLFHSSCVVNAKGEAYVFFGPSGAGKTTIAKLCGEGGGAILGDDMNLLNFGSKNIEIEAATVGQRFFCKESFGKKYPLKRIYWLNKGQENKCERIHSGQLALMLSSFANLFWDQLDTRQYQQLFQLLTRAHQELDIYRLTFTQNKGVWDYVQHIR